MPPAKRSTKKAPAKRTNRGPKPGTMSAEHKRALAQGREASRHVRAYLDALEISKPKRGRKLDPKSVEKRIAFIDEQLKEASGFEKLNLLADRESLQGKLAGSGQVIVDLSSLRREFVKHAKVYGERKKISYATWRAAGVPADDLKAAGISRSRG